jgi:hypothetical protein
MGAMEVTERACEATVDWTGDRDLQPSVEHAPQGGDARSASIGRGEGRARVWPERLAGVGELHPAPVAMKERFAQLTLKTTDLRTHRRLSH